MVVAGDTGDSGIRGNDMSQLTAAQVADYFLAQVDEECGDSISNLKLQKLLYYAQGFHLAIFDSPLFDDEITAWQHGPVVRSLYRQYKDYGAGALPIPEDVDFSIYTNEVKELLDEISSIFGQFSAWKLSSMTHNEPPWEDAYALAANSTISHSALKQYFKTQLIDGE